jgi:hypothetical protein
MRKCLAEGCTNQTRRKNYCDRHYKRWKRHGDPNVTLTSLDKSCVICGGLAAKDLKTDHPLCHKHYGRWKRHGDATKILINEKGQGYITDKGYKAFTIDGKQYLEHRMVMEKILGRPLEKDEQVHHKNGRRADNHPDNLELWCKSHPSGQRPEDLVVWAKQIILRYQHITTSPSNSLDTSKHAHLGLSQHCSVPE